MSADLAPIATILKAGRFHTRGDGTLSDAEFLAYGTDRTRRFQPDPCAIAFPGNLEELSSLLRYCHANSIPVVPSGGRTGYAGGAVASGGELVVSMERMNRLIAYHPHLPAITVEAGMVTQELQRLANEKGLYYPVDFAATGSSQIGGNIATNAGGLRVIRYGNTRDQVMGLTVVTGRGEILRFNGKILKNNTGYDLKQLFIGSEGTLGIIAEATMRLVPLIEDTTVILFALQQFADALRLLEECRIAGLPLLSFEYFDEESLSVVREHTALPRPFPIPCEHYILMELENSPALSGTALDRLLEKIVEQEIVLEATMADSPTRKKNLWGYRESISESLSMHRTVHKNDISVPLDMAGEFLDLMHRTVHAIHSDIHVAVFGHLGDGNLHINLIKPSSMSDEVFFALCETMGEPLYGALSSYCGSVSAEHGIGLLKRDLLGYSRSATEIEAMRGIKKIFDPSGIMNPGKIFTIARSPA